MKDSTISLNLSRLRKQNSLSQAELAEQAGISVTAYGQLERGESEPKSSTLRALAQALGVRITDLVREYKPLEGVRFRCSPKMRSCDLILRETAVWLQDFNALETLLGEKTEYKLSDIESRLQDVDDIQERCDALSRELRESFGIHRGEPIRDIWGFLENVCGIKVRAVNLANTDFFGLSVSEKGGGPAIVVNTHERISVERWIYTAAHELGHILLHKDSYNGKEQARAREEYEEKEAHLFASSFLMPRSTFLSEWEETEGLSFVARVLKVKMIFNVSYLTVLVRLSKQFGHDWDVLKSRFIEEYQQEYNQRIKLHSEPESLPEQAFSPQASVKASEEPKGLFDAAFSGDRLKKLVRRALVSQEITFSRAAEILKLSTGEMRSLSKRWI